MLQHIPERETSIAIPANANPARLYLPLLVHPDEQVQRQTTLALTATYGNHAFTLVRRLLSDTDLHTRHLAERALHILGHHSGHPVECRPFRGMHIECLGMLRVYIGHHEIQPQDWAQQNGGKAGGRKVQSVLAYLLHRGAYGATADEIITAIWSGEGKPQALARTLTALRQTLEQFGSAELAEHTFLYTDRRYLLVPSEYSSDVRSFEHAAHIAEQTEADRDLATAIPLYRQACRLYGGSYFATAGVAVEYIEERRAELHNAYLNAIERQAEYAYRQNDDDLCLALCIQGRRADPADESLTLWMLRCYAHQRRDDELNRTYQRYLRAIGHTPEADDPVARWMAERHGGNANMK